MCYKGRRPLPWSTELFHLLEITPTSFSADLKVDSILAAQTPNPSGLHGSGGEDGYQGPCKALICRADAFNRYSRALAAPDFWLDLVRLSSWHLSRDLQTCSNRRAPGNNYLRTRRSNKFRSIQITSICCIEIDVYTG